MCRKVAQRLGFWAVSHYTKRSNPAETVYIFYFLLTCLLTLHTLNTVLSPNVLLKLQTSFHKIVMEHSTFISIFLRIANNMQVNNQVYKFIAEQYTRAWFVPF